MKHLSGVMALSSLMLSGAIVSGCCEAEIEVTNNGTASHTVEFEDQGGVRTFGPGQSEIWTITWREESPGDTGTQIPYFVDGADCGTYHIWDGERDRVLDIDDGYVALMCSD